MHVFFCLPVLATWMTALIKIISTIGWIVMKFGSDIDYWHRIYGNDCGDKKQQKTTTC